jgi:hypothetical protein
MASPSSQLDGTVSRNSESHQREKSCPRAARAWKPPERTTDTSAMGMTVLLRVNTFDSIGEAYLLILYEG